MKQINIQNYEVSHKAFPFVWSFLKHEKLNFSIWLIMEVAADFFGIFIAQYFNKKVINYFQIEDQILINGIFLVFLYIIFNNCVFLFKTAMMKFKIKSLECISNKVMNKLFSYTIEHSMNYFNNSFSGAISSKIQSVGYSSADFIESIKKIITSLIIFILIPFFFAKISIYLSILFIIFGAIYFYFFSKSSREWGKKRKDLSEANSGFFGFLVDDFSNIRNIKIFSNLFMEKLCSKKYIQKIRKTERNLMESQMVNQTISFICTFSLFFSIISTSAVFLSKNKINFGDFTFVIIILSIANFVLKGFIGALNGFYGHKAVIENGLETILKPIEIKDKNNAKNINTINGKIVFKDVIFAYGELNKKEVLSNENKK